jgi:hypothetical protein
MIFENDFFQKLAFTKGQIDQYLHSARHDLGIATDSNIADVTFRFSYDALIKIGITLIASKGYKIRSNAGHHIKILDKTAEILADEDIAIIGNRMRQLRNLNLYDGSYGVSDKESEEYLNFVKKVFNKVSL